MTRESNHTFIVLAYKDSPFLERCLLSLKSQTMKSDLLISTSTPSVFINKIACKYGIKVIEGKGGGIAKDWNFAYQQCKTKYLTLAHQDDVYLPYYTERCLSVVDKYNLVVFTNYEEIDSDDKVRPKNINLVLKRIMLLPYLFKQSIKSIFWKKLIVTFGNPYCCPSAFYNKELIRKINFSDNLKFVIDWEAWYRMSVRTGTISNIYSVLIQHRIHTGSETTKQIIDNTRINEEIWMFRKIMPSWLARLVVILYKQGSKANL